MATYKIVNPGMGWPNVTQTGTYDTSSGPAAPLRFGQRVIAFDTSFGHGEFVFVFGSNITAGNLVQITGAQGGARKAGSGTASAGPVGFACGAMSATNVWGFVQVVGVFDSASFSAAAALGAGIKMGTVSGAINVTTATNDTHQLIGMYNASSDSASSGGSVMMMNPIYRGY